MEPPAAGSTIALFVPCLADAFFPRSAIACALVLEHLGFKVAFPETQTCCGQPFYNSGNHTEGRALIERMAKIFEPYEVVVTPSGSCASLVREHAATMYRDPPAALQELAGKTYEFVEFLTDVLAFDPAEHSVEWNGRVSCHDACHLRGLGLFGQNATLMGKIEGVEVAPNDRPEECCGFGGMFSTKFPVVSSGLAHKRVHYLTCNGAETIVCNDAGCAMNIRSAVENEGKAVRMTSTAEVLAEAMGLLDAEPAA